MQQIKFYRVQSLPQEGSGQKGEIGSLYFLHDDLNNFNDLYVCIGDYEFESYSAHLYWADDPEGGSGGGSWEDSETGEPIDLSNYLQKTGGRMTGNLDFANNSAILFDDGQTAGIYPRQEALSIEAGGGSISLDSMGCVFSTPIQASGFSIPNGTSDQILLADGTTTALPTLPELNYLPLSGGTLTGSFNVSSIFAVSTTDGEATPIVLGDNTSNKSVRINYSTNYDNDGELNIINNPHLIIGPTNSAALFLNRSGIQAVDSNNSTSVALHLNPQGGDVKIGSNLMVMNNINAASIQLTDSLQFKSSSSSLLKHESTNILQYDDSNSSICLGENQEGLISETITLSAKDVNASNNITASGVINATAFYETSDARKKDIKSDLSLDKCYDLIDKCQTVIYSLKDQTKEQVGMIAQEIEEFFPEVVATDEEGFKSLAYDRLVVICFKVLKDVIKRLEKLENV